MASVARKVATYRDVLDAPEHTVAEVIDGDLHTHRRPARRHALVSSYLGADLTLPFGRGRGGPGGWVILDEPELHLGPEPAILVPDLAGWRVDRATFDGEGAFIDVVPDWVCEVLSPSTAAFDRSRKADLYAELGVSYLWLVDVTTRQIEAFRLAEAKWLRLGAYGQIDARIEPFDAVPLEVPALFTFPNER
jgi:Uma2 family endonuclease